MREKYNFVDRKEEYNFVSQNYILRKNIDIYGFSGVGKTSFIYFFTKQFFIKSCLDRIKIAIGLDSEIENNIVMVEIDKQYNDLTSFIQRIADSIDSNHIDKIDSNKINLIDLLEGIRCCSREEDAVVNFSLMLSCLLKNIFILFDNIHLVKQEVWNDFITKVVYFKYEEKIGFRIITIGRKRKDCVKIFRSMKDQTVPCKLENFTEENTREMVRSLAARHNFDIKKEKIAFELIFKLTIGHPESICIAVKHWTNDYSKPLDGEDIRSRYGEGIAALLKQFIQVKILPPLSSALKEEEHYPSGETPLSLLQHLAPLRLLPSLPSRMLRPVLCGMFPDFYRIKESTFFESLFRIFYNFFLFEENEKNKQKYRYKMSEIVRHILLEDLRVNNSMQFKEINQKISVVYDENIESFNIMRRYEHLTEKIYHIILPVADVQERENSVRAAISEHVKQHDNTNIKQLQNMLQNDEWLSDKINWKAFFKSLQL